MAKSSYILFFILLLSGINTTCAQQIIAKDTVNASEPDLISIDSARKKKIFEPNAKKSGMYSSIIPGMGQLYNRQYWKLPIIYAGLGVAGYILNYNLTHYQKYRKAYIYSIDNDPSTSSGFEGIYTSDNLKQIQNEYRKNLDLTVFLTAIGYSLQIMDAVAGAHLKNFDVSEDISMKFSPVVNPNYIGVGLVMNFK